MCFQCTHICQCYVLRTVILCVSPMWRAGTPHTFLCMCVWCVHAFCMHRITLHPLHSCVIIMTDFIVDFIELSAGYLDSWNTKIYQSDNIHCNSSGAQNNALEYILGTSAWMRIYLYKKHNFPCHEPIFRNEFELDRHPWDMLLHYAKHIKIGIGADIFQSSDVSCTKQFRYSTVTWLLHEAIIKTK